MQNHIGFRPFQDPGRVVGNPNPGAAPQIGDRNLFTLMNLIETIEHYQLMVAVRTKTPERAYKAAVACINGGIRLVEITFSVPGAEEVIRELNQKTNACIGAGTILSISDLKKALKAGAKYIVSPHLDEEIVQSTKKEGAVSIPGACTPTEIHRAYRNGGDIIKLFPFVDGGTQFPEGYKGADAPLCVSC